MFSIHPKRGFVLPLLLVVAACSSVPSGDPGGPPLFEQMSATDTRLADQAAQEALENLQSDKVLRWKNPETGNSGTMTPIKTYYNESKRAHCRKYRELITVGDISEQYSDTACRNSRGTWVSAI